MAFFTASYQQLLWAPTQSGPPSPFGLVRLSLPHLVYNSVRSLTETVWLLSWLSYIIVQRPLSRILDLWNGMFDRHQAEITVMQFTGHSLQVHQSMSVPWEFFTSSHFISQFPPTRFPLTTAIRMCHLLPVHHLGMAFLAGSKAKIQQYLLTDIFKFFTRYLVPPFTMEHKGGCKGLVWFSLVLWHSNHYGLFNAKSSLYIYIEYIWFVLVGFYGISTIVGYFIPNPLYTYILDIYDLFWLGFMAYQPL